MFRKTKKIFVPVICLLLAFVMIFMTACNKLNNGAGGADVPGGDVIVTPGESDREPEDPPVGPDEPEDFGELFDYEVDDGENFVYNLVYNDLLQQYDCFAGYIGSSQSDEEAVYGIGYTDYEDAYVDETGRTYFSSGFISIQYDGKPLAADDGLEVHSVEDVESDLYSYVYSYSTEDIHKHCLLYGHLYVKYDIVDGVLKYSEEEFAPGMDVDPSRGNIYDYAAEKYIYIVESADYVPTVGVSIIGEAEYQEIVDAVNEILKSQDASLKYADLETFTAYAVEALNSYILGLQEETFMGIPTESLKEFAKDLNPLEHLQIQMDEDGNIRIGIIKVEKLATTWEKILTSIVCAYSVVAGVCCNILGDIIPGTKILFGATGGALIGAAMEAFSQVVISGTSVDTMSWERVAVAAVSGSIAGALSVKIGSMNSVLVRNTVDTLVDGVIGGGEFFVNALIDGESLSQALTQFGYGLATGIVVSAVLKGVTYVAKKGTSWVKKALADVPDTVNSRAVKQLSEEGLENARLDKIAKDSAENVANDVNDVTKKTVKNVKRTPGVNAAKISNEQLKEAKSILEQIDMNTDFSADKHVASNGLHITGKDNNHFDISRIARKINHDTVFTNVDVDGFKQRLLDDLHSSKIYLKNNPTTNSSTFSRWIFDVKNSKYLRGLDLVTKKNGIKNYRLIIDVINGIVEIYDAYPILSIGQ